MSARDAVKILDSDRLSELLKKPDIIFVDFWAKWCAPCLQFAPVFAQAAEKNTDIVFASINIEQERELAETFQIRSIPHLMVFKQGIAIYSESGSLPESILLELIDQARNADVSAIQRTIQNHDV